MVKSICRVYPEISLRGLFKNFREGEGGGLKPIRYAPGVSNLVQIIFFIRGEA